MRMKTTKYSKMKGNAVGSTTIKKRFYPDGQIILFREKECNQFTEGRVRFPLHNFALQTGRRTVKYALSFEHLIIKLKHEFIYSTNIYEILTTGQVDVRAQKT